VPNGCAVDAHEDPGGELEPSAREVVLQAGDAHGQAEPEQFAYEDQRVLDVVWQGHAEMWHAMQEPRPDLCRPGRDRRRTT